MNRRGFLASLIAAPVAAKLTPKVREFHWPDVPRTRGVWSQAPYEAPYDQERYWAMRAKELLRNDFPRPTATSPDVRG